MGRKLVKLIVATFVVCCFVLVGRLAYAETSGVRDMALYYNSRQVGNIVLRGGSSFVDIGTVKGFFKRDFDTLKVEKINGEAHIAVRDVARYYGFDLLWNPRIASVDMFNGLTKDEKALVAHGGGYLEGKVVSVKEALDNAVRHKVRLIEVDIIWTSDHHPVLSHGWWSLSSNLRAPIWGPVTLERFKQLEFKYDWTQLSFYDLVDWMRENRNTFIITDVKERNIELAELIVSMYPELLNRFIPQVYTFEEYEIVRGLGFNRIIITLYKMPMTPEQIYARLSGLNKHQLFAVTAPPERLIGGLATNLANDGIYVYSHTINDFETRVRLSQIGVKGFYTDVFDVPLP